MLEWYRTIKRVIGFILLLVFSILFMLAGYTGYQEQTAIANSKHLSLGEYIVLDEHMAFIDLFEVDFSNKIAEPYSDYRKGDIEKLFPLRFKGQSQHDSIYCWYLYKEGDPLTDLYSKSLSTGDKSPVTHGELLISKLYEGTFGPNAHAAMLNHPLNSHRSVVICHTEQTGSYWLLFGAGTIGLVIWLFILRGFIQRRKS